MEILGCITLCLVVDVSYGLNTYDLPSSGLLSLTNPDMDMDWVTFKKSYNRTYADVDEEVRRRLFWEDTIMFIAEHNKKYERGESSYTVGENEFSDMAEDEFGDIFMHGVILPEVPEEYPEALTEPNPDAPLSLDWRLHNLVSEVKHQGNCGSCWAFSALGALEGQHAKHHGKLVDLSEQNLVDCCRGKWRSWGCRGGWMNTAYSYIMGNNGLDGESCYPYEARDNACRYRASCAASNDRGYKNVGKNEHSLQSDLSAVGPIAIAMDANHRSFWSYKTGVYYEPRCNKRHPTHAMLAVGYGTLQGRACWLIKNSWGTDWGDKGYLYLSRNSGDTCGVSSWASYPVLKKYKDSVYD